MGLTKMYLENMNESIRATLGGLRGKRMLELGNQRIDDDPIPEKTGKQYFENRGLEHISVDLNGLDGAQKRDLSRPEQFAEWNNYFDIVTNSGTSEHVEPLAAQYECFKIMHNCLKVGGIALHIVPDINELRIKGARKGHCANYYSFDFFKLIAEENNYRLLSLRILDDLIYSCLKKVTDAPFMKDRKAFFKFITRRRRTVFKNLIHNLWDRCKIGSVS